AGDERAIRRRRTFRGELRMSEPDDAIAPDPPPSGPKLERQIDLEAVKARYERVGGRLAPFGSVFIGLCALLFLLLGFASLGGEIVVGGVGAGVQFLLSSATFFVAMETARRGWLATTLLLVAAGLVGPRFVQQLIAGVAGLF
ncbi:MAG: hypothetical protein AAF907_12295, partial [Planctomycetota bacterium]